jgi:hypothetical protein
LGRRRSAQGRWPDVGADESNSDSDGSTDKASPDGTTVPSATQIVDNLGAVWTVGAGGAILRNGVQAAGGWGSTILWTGRTIYVQAKRVVAVDGTGWVNIGSQQPGGTTPGVTTSPDGTTVPAATQLVDKLGAVWTIGAGGAILRNGVQAAGGQGSAILWTGSTIYVRANEWWQWTGSGWTNVGSQQPEGTTPGVTTSPDGTMVPAATQIVDKLGAVWTIDAGGAILRNGVQAAGGRGSTILWTGGTIYVRANEWWQWTGSGWVNVGQAF